MLFSSYQSFETVKDLENYKSRLEKLPQRFSDLISAFSRGISKGITLPKESTEILIEKCNAFVITQDFADSPFGFKDKVVALTGNDQYLVSTIRDFVVPAFLVSLE